MILKIALNKSAYSVITLTLSENDDDYCFENVKDTLKKLISITDEHKITKFNLIESSHSPALNFLTKNIWNDTQNETFKAENGEVKAIICDTYFDEAEYIACDIIKRVKNGYKFRDIAVIARNIESYKGIIDAVFSKHGIKSRLFDRIDLIEMPIFKLIRSAINIKVRDWALDDVMVYLKTGITSVTDDELYQLQKYVFTWNISGSQWYEGERWFMNPEGYSDRLTDESKQYLDRINDIRIKVIRPLEKLHEYFDGEHTVTEICTAIYNFVCEQNIPMYAEQNGDDEIRVYNCLCDALETMTDTIPNKKLNAKIFLGLFTVVVNESDVGVLPALIDEISLGSANLLRAQDIKHAYIIGVNEGVFPASPQANSFFCDSEKVDLEEFGINLSPPSQAEVYDELYYFYKSISLPSESITISCVSNSAEKNSSKPSIAFERVLKLFSNDILSEYNSIKPDELICDRSSALERINDISEENLKIALTSVLNDDTEAKQILASQDKSIIAGEYEYDKDLMKKIFPSNMKLSQTKLEAYAKCPFQYHCSYTLNLKEDKIAKFSPLDTGNLVHKILEKFLSKFDFENGVPDIDQQTIDNLTDNLINEYLSRIFGNEAIANVSNRMVQLFLRLKRTLKLLINNILDEFKQSKFYPKFYELKIEDMPRENAVQSLRIPLPDGSYVSFNGSIDRVDILRENNKIYVRVIDYKTGKKSFNLEDVSLGINMQMLIYLFSIWKDGKESFKRLLSSEDDICPAGILYFEARTPNIPASSQLPQHEIYKRAEESLTRNGLLLNDIDILHSMEANLNEKYIPIKLTTKGDIDKRSLSSLRSLEELGRLSRQVENTVSKLAYEIKQGKSNCAPIDANGHKGCTYCKYAYICRRPEAFKKEQF